MIKKAEKNANNSQESMGKYDFFMALRKFFQKLKTLSVKNVWRNEKIIIKWIISLANYYLKHCQHWEFKVFYFVAKTYTN